MFAGSRKAAAALAVLALLALAPSAIAAEPAAEPVIRPAVDGILAAFETHPIVGISDHHGLANAGEFYNRLVKDPRFAAQVGNVVVEFGGAAHQATIDRYLAGENVPYAELRRVWSDTVGAVPTVNTVMYPLFFAQVRAVNARLAPAQRIRVWLGEPPIDWSAIRTQADLEPYMDRRDEYPAQLIDREILARGKKALVIYGGFHFNPPGLPPGVPPIQDLKQRIEARHPGAIYVIADYIGFAQPACSAAFEAEMAWPPGTLASPVRGTSLEAALQRPGCSFGSNLRAVAPPGAPPTQADQQLRMQRRTQEVLSGVAADALIYFGPQASLMNSPGDATLVMDEAYFREIARRFRIMTGAPASFAAWVDLASRPPAPYGAR